jgi:hypothetical protein
VANGTVILTPNGTHALNGAAASPTDGAAVPAAGVAPAGTAPAPGRPGGPTV